MKNKRYQWSLYPGFEYLYKLSPSLHKLKSINPSIYFLECMEYGIECKYFNVHLTANLKYEKECYVYQTRTFINIIVGQLVRQLWRNIIKIGSCCQWTIRSPLNLAVAIMFPSNQSYVMRKWGVARERRLWWGKMISIKEDWSTVARLNSKIMEEISPYIGKKTTARKWYKQVKKEVYQSR